MSNVVNENPSEKITKTLSHVSYSEVATKLLYDKFLLTALELHTELVESGRELPILKEFFSNPGNFEHQSRPDVSLPISRSGSQATLDSLDLTRYSEDGERGVDERVAVLEFELRKAKETISALRANLTVATESETTKPDAKTLKPNSSEIIKPHERRALNFLINEYLLSHGYKLTSITFSDENENQDFEDWDDVGLNIPKPSELLFLYREALKVIGFNSISTACQTEISNVDEEKDKMLLYLNSEINNYKSLIDTLESDKQDLQKQYENLIAQQNQALVSHSSTTELLNSALENETISTNSTSPERFEIIDKPGRSLKIKGGNSLITSEDDESANSLNNPDMDWTKVTIALDTARNIQKQNSEHDSCSLKSEPINIVNIHSNRNLPVTYQKELFSQCFKNISTKSDNTILDDLLKEDITCERLVNTVTVCLPRIIPNVILNKREEVIPLLLSAVHLNPSSAERDKLLQQLFNLKKRPTEEERPKILAGLIGIAQIAGVNLVENELLPLCWEQISHKYTERRLLVIETCICLAPYISSTIRNSLMLSILQQMLTEEKEPSVRELSVQALALVVGLCDDPDKYSACEELALYALSDSDSSVVSVCNNLLLPVLAKLALDLDKFQTIFMKKLFKKLRQLITRTEILAEEKVVHVITAFNILIPFTLISVVSADAVISKIDQDTKSIQLRTEFLKLCSPLSNPQNFYEGDVHIGNLIASFQTMMSEEKCSSWPQLDWLLDTMLQELLGITNHIEVTQESLLQSTINLFRNISISFGKQFTKWKLKRLFESHIQNLEISLANFNVNHSSPKLSLIPVYLIGILNSVEYAEEISSLVKRLTCALSLSGTSLYSLEISVKGLSENKDLQASIVAALWDNVVHQRPVVRSSTASLFASMIGKVEESLLVNRVTPALVTLASDIDILVRTATVPCIGTLVTSCSVREVHDKAYMQLQSLLSEPSIKEDHSMACQLVSTLGKITNASEPWFREEVILPQLAYMAEYTTQIANQTRRKDLAIALVNAFSMAVYCPMSKQTIGSCLLPGLRHLESLDIPALNTHYDGINSMIRDAESRLDTALSSPVSTPSVRLERVNSLSQNVNQGVEDMRQRMSKIFQPNVVKTASNLSNLQGMFKKK